MSSLESQLAQSQQIVAELQLQVANLEGERQRMEQALQGAHAEIQTLRGSAGYSQVVFGTSRRITTTNSLSALQSALLFVI